MRKDRRLTIPIMAILAVSLLVTGIYAYFTYVDFKENAATIGNSEVTIREVFENPDIEPNEDTVITKKVSVDNTGINTSAIRIKAEFSSKEVLSWVTPDYNTADWTKSGDWWYYNRPLMPGEETEPLINKLTCNKPTAEQIENFDVYLYAESRVCDNEANLNVMKTLFN